MKKSTNKKTVSENFKKTDFPLERIDFLSSDPKGFTFSDGENSLEIIGNPREFSSGSLGYYLMGKITLQVAGELVKFQFGANLTAVNSKTAR